MPTFGARRCPEREQLYVNPLARAGLPMRRPGTGVSALDVNGCRARGSALLGTGDVLSTGPRRIRDTRDDGAQAGALWLVELARAGATAAVSWPERSRMGMSGTLPRFERGQLHDSPLARGGGRCGCGLHMSARTTVRGPACRARRRASQ